MININIEKDFDDFYLDIHFKSDAKRIAILGASGSGKSLTLKTISGIFNPDRGSISIGSNILFDSTTKVNLKPQKRNIGYMPQNYALFPNMTVAENVACGYKGDKSKEKEKVNEIINRFHIKEIKDKFPVNISGGEQQRVALARIMIYTPDIILLDEPFSALDLYLKDYLHRELYSQLLDYLGTVIMVTHDRDEAYRFCEDIIIIDEGRIIRAGKTKEVFKKPNYMMAARLTGCKNISKARRLSDNILEAIDWGIEIKCKKTLPEDFNYIGYRAHKFIPTWGIRQQNSIPFNLDSKSDLQFEKYYYIKPEKDTFEKKDLISYFVQQDKLDLFEKNGLPHFLMFDEDEIMFLK